MDAGSAGEDLDQVRDRYATAHRDDGVGSDHPADHQLVYRERSGPERRGGRAWLYVAFAVVVIAIGAGVVRLAAGGAVAPAVDPTRLAAPVTLPPSAQPPEPAPHPTGTESVAGGDVCPGSTFVNADDPPGWQDASVTEPGAACGGRYSTHATSQQGGVFYRWTSKPSQAGHCDIAVYIPDTPRANVARAHYSVLDGAMLVENFVIAQAKDHGQWVPAGTYPAGGLSVLTVRMDNRSDTSGTVVASAVRFSCHPG